MNKFLQQAIDNTTKAAKDIKLECENYDFKIPVKSTNKNDIDCQYINDIESGKHLESTKLYAHLAN